MTNYIFVLSFGRTGSTLVTSMIQEQLKSESFSQEINFQEALLILYKYKKNVISNETFLKEINTYITKVQSIDIKRQITNPHYYNVSQNGVILPKYLNNTFPRLINIVMKNLFGKQKPISGCKILIGNEKPTLKNKYTVITSQNLLEIIQCFNDNPNINFVYNYRNYDDMTRSRKMKGFKFIIDYETYNLYLQICKENNIQTIDYDDLLNSLKNYITNIGYKFSIDKYNAIKSKRHSY